MQSYFCSLPKSFQETQICAFRGTRRNAWLSQITYIQIVILRTRVVPMDPAELKATCRLHPVHINGTLHSRSILSVLSLVKRGHAKGHRNWPSDTKLLFMMNLHRAAWAELPWETADASCFVLRGLQTPEYNFPVAHITLTLKDFTFKTCKWTGKISRL